MQTLQELRDARLEAITPTHSPHTVKIFRRVSLNFLDWLEDRELCKAEVMGWSDALSQHHAGSTVDLSVRTVHTWFRWCQLMGLMESNPADGIPKLPNAKLKQPEWLNDEEVEQVLAAAWTPKKPDRRTAIFLLAIYAGLRKMELVNFDTRDIDWEKRVLWVKHNPAEGRVTKSRKSRSVPLHPRLAEALQALPPGKVYVGGADIYQRLIQKVRKKCGIKKLRWHTLRHTFASRLCLKNVSLRKLQAWLGHASITMTERYSHLETGVFDDDIGRAK